MTPKEAEARALIEALSVAWAFGDVEQVDAALYALKDAITGPAERIAKALALHSACSCCHPPCCKACADRDTYPCPTVRALSDPKEASE